MTPDKRIADLRLCRRYHPNSPSALAAAFHLGWRHVAFQASFISNPEAWVFGIGADRFPTLLGPLLRQYSFDHLWLFLDSPVDPDAVDQLRQRISSQKITAVTPDNLNPSASDPTILFLPDPSLAFKYWRLRNRILSFGKDTPVSYRLVVPF